MANLIDTHCHLYFEQFGDDLEKVLENAQASGVDHFIVPGVDILTSQAAIRLSEKYEAIHAAVGIHPNSQLLKSENNNALHNLEELLTHPKVVAIGEIGLDFYREQNSRERQIDYLNLQLELAQKHQLPVILHNREATDDLYYNLEKWKTKLDRSQSPIRTRPGVMHSFSEGPNWIKPFIDLGFYISYTGVVTFKSAELVRESVRKTPLDKFLVETDAPFLAPHPHRGSRNEPAYVKFVAKSISKLLELDKTLFFETTSRNAQNLFGLSGL